MIKPSNFAIKLKDKCVLGFGKKGFEDGSKMVEKGVFNALENKTRTINLSMVWHLCVLHFHPIQPQVRSRISKNKLALFSWISSTCIGEHVLVLSKTY
jgi:hypothetical protein